MRLIVVLSRVSIGYLSGPETRRERKHITWPVPVMGGRRAVATTAANCPRHRLVHRPAVCPLFAPQQLPLAVVRKAAHDYYECATTGNRSTGTDIGHHDSVQLVVVSPALVRPAVRSR